VVAVIQLNHGVAAVAGLATDRSGVGAGASGLGDEPGAQGVESDRPGDAGGLGAAFDHGVQSVAADRDAAQGATLSDRAYRRCLGIERGQLGQRGRLWRVLGVESAQVGPVGPGRGGEHRAHQRLPALLAGH
jgi:hypothetical protein